LDRSCWLLTYQAYKNQFLQVRGDRVRHRLCISRSPPRLPGKPTFSEEIVPSKKSGDGFLALRRCDGELHIAAPHDESRITQPAVQPNTAALVNLGEKGFRFERRPAFGR
jgi:hypothetical protein